MPSLQHSITCVQEGSGLFSCAAGLGHSHVISHKLTLCSLLASALASGSHHNSVSHISNVTMLSG